MIRHHLFGFLRCCLQKSANLNANPFFFQLFLRKRAIPPDARIYYIFDATFLLFFWLLNASEERNSGRGSLVYLFVLLILSRRQEGFLFPEGIFPALAVLLFSLSNTRRSGILGEFLRPRIHRCLPCFFFSFSPFFFTVFSSTLVFLLCCILSFYSTSNGLFCSIIFEDLSLWIFFYQFGIMDLECVGFVT